MGLAPQYLNGDFIQQIRFGMYSWVSVEVMRAHTEALTTTSATVSPSHVDIERISVASTVKIASTSEDDTNAGDGARVVLVQGVGPSLDGQQELVTMNGSAAVNTTLRYLGVNNILVMSAGDAGVNIGDIHAGEGVLTSGVPATQYYVTPASFGIGWTPVLTVPSGKVGLPYQLICTLRDTGKTAELDFRVYDFDAAVDRNIAPIGLAQGDFEFFLNAPIALNPGDQMNLRGFINTNTAAITVFMVFLLIDKDRFAKGLG
jgi:hypothetical protein